MSEPAGVYGLESAAAIVQLYSIDIEVFNLVAYRLRLNVDIITVIRFRAKQLESTQT